MSVVQQLLSHTTPAITLSLDRHVLPSEQRRLVDDLGAAMMPDGGGVAVSLAVSAEDGPRNLAPGLG